MRWIQNKIITINLVIFLIPLSILTLLLVNKQLTKPIIINFFEGNISQFCINFICIKQNNDKWIILSEDKTIPANNDLVVSLINKFKDLKLTENVSQNKEKFVIFGIGTSITVLDINNKKIEIGDINANYNGTYVKPVNEENIYLVDIILNKNNLTDIDYWINKTVTNIPILQIKRLSIDNGKNVFEIKPENGQWPNNKVTETVANLKSVNFIDNKNFKKEKEIKIVVYTDDNKYDLTIGRFIKEDKKEHFWATVDEKYYYEISREDFSLLTGKIN